MREPLNHLNSSIAPADAQLQHLARRISQTVERDELVQSTVTQLRERLQVDRVVLYYFYRQWRGQVTFESLSDPHYSLFGESGPDECFNGEYAALYEAGRVRAIADIEVEPIQPCHREFLRNMMVKANLVVPVLTQRGLWGLLVAHHCKTVRSWSEADIQAMQQGAEQLSTARSIRDSILPN